MRLIDADELIEHAWRDRLDSRELIADMINRAPTVVEVPVRVPVNMFSFNEETVRILEKIRAEIEEYKSRKLTLAIGVEDLEKGKQIALEYVLAILDKYKAERNE